MIQLDTTIVSRLLSEKDLFSVADLIYQNYKNKGFCSDKKEIIDYLNNEKDIITFYTKSTTGVMKSTVTLAFDKAENQLPSEYLYQAEITQLRKKKIKLVELTKLSASNDDDQSIFHLFIISFLLMQRLRFSHLIAMVEPKHEIFYCRKYGFKRIGSLKKDPMSNNADTVLLFLDVQQIITKCLLHNRKKKSNMLWSVIRLDYLGKYKKLIDDFIKFDFRKNLEGLSPSSVV